MLADCYWAKSTGIVVRRIAPLLLVNVGVLLVVTVDTTLKDGDIDTGGGRVWLRTTAGQTFVVVEPRTLAVLARIGDAAGSGALRYRPAGVWTTAHDRHTLSWWSDAATTGTPTAP